MDNAATGWPKPEAVYRAVEYQMRQIGAAAGRSAYDHALRSADVVAHCRRRIARWIGAPSPDCVVMTANGTAALNLAIHGLVQPGDHVVTTAAEHNSVLRPLHDLATRMGVTWDVVPCDAAGQVCADAVLAAVRPDTRLVAVCHASNVTGAVQPIAEIGQRLRDHEAVLLCDAAQTLGYLPLDVQAMGIDLLAAPGHKGAGGPLGTGLLYVAPSLHRRLHPIIQGGSGSRSSQLTMPEAMPERLEAGNLNVPAIAGLEAALRWLAEQDQSAMQAARLQLAEQLRGGLADCPGLRLIDGGGGLPLASFIVPGLDPGEVAAILDAEFGVQVRAGLHCAASIHDFLGTAPAGTVRISCGHLTEPAALRQAIDAVRQLAAAVN